ncbi:peptide/nickel transport system permease protein [Propionibacterium cyclohexanicum]|uniref:Peptide/nickel transport system permease protein n=1 Tax=Propionibacterium cyclohexanicum TaxID=64702 RepID=A0A1H9RLU3_9ACTN|nr:ABC transporter permease [Propionibacterium cyclohexanicum]SER73720.1 peptide/nickel transport system permease protein [Propionibacterium cyclohexanicum]
MSQAPVSLAQSPGDSGRRLRGPFAEALGQLRHDRMGMIGLGCVLLVVGAGLFAPVLAAIAGQDPYTFHSDLIDAANGGQPIGPLGGVSSTHWFGVEPQTGRDLFALVVYGIRTSVLIALGATFLSVTFGVLLGLAMGYFGGVFEYVMGRFVDFMFGFPSLLFLIAIQLIVPPEFPRTVLLALSLAVFGWVSTARLIHGQAKSLVNRDFIEAARSTGTPPGRILRAEMLPNLVGTVAVITALSFPTTISTAAGLSFLGVGVSPTTPELGRLIGQSVTWTYTGADVGFLLFPGAALLILMLGSTLLGDALRDAFDVRMGER